MLPFSDKKVSSTPLKFAEMLLVLLFTAQVWLVIWLMPILFGGVTRGGHLKQQQVSILDVVKVTLMPSHLVVRDIARIDYLTEGA